MCIPWSDIDHLKHKEYCQTRKKRKKIDVVTPEREIKVDLALIQAHRLLFWVREAEPIGGAGQHRYTIG